MIPASLSKTFLDEHHSDPVWHGVCAGTSEVPVDDDDGDEDADGVHDEGEEEILGDEGQHEGGGGQDLGDEQQEHNQRQQNADTEGHLTQHHLQQLSHSRPVSDVLRCLKAFTSPSFGYLALGKRSNFNFLEQRGRRKGSVFEHRQTSLTCLLVSLPTFSPASAGR